MNTYVTSQPSVHTEGTQSYRVELTDYAEGRYGNNGERMPVCFSWGDGGNHGRPDCFVDGLLRNNPHLRLPDRLSYPMATGYPNDVDHAIKLVEFLNTSGLTAPCLVWDWYAIDGVAILYASLSEEHYDDLLVTMNGSTIALPLTYAQASLLAKLQETAGWLADEGSVIEGTVLYVFVRPIEYGHYLMSDSSEGSLHILTRFGDMIPNETHCGLVKKSRV